MHTHGGNSIDANASGHLKTKHTTEPTEFFLSSGVLRLSAFLANPVRNDGPRYGFKYRLLAGNTFK